MLLVKPNMGSQIMVGIKALFMICLVWMTDIFYGMMSMIGLLPQNIRDFIFDTKEIVGLLTTVVILIIYLRQLFNGNKKKDE